MRQQVARQQPLHATRRFHRRTISCNRRPAPCTVTPPHRQQSTCIQASCKNGQVPDRCSCSISAGSTELSRRPLSRRAVVQVDSIRHLQPRVGSGATSEDGKFTRRRSCKAKASHAELSRRPSALCKSSVECSAYHRRSESRGQQPPQLGREQRRRSSSGWVRATCASTKGRRLRTRCRNEHDGRSLAADCFYLVRNSL